MLGTHQVSMTSLDAMAAGRSDPAIVHQLSRANRSIQLTLLRAVLDRAGEVAMGPLPPLDEAWTLLADAHRHAGAAVDRVITHPRTSLWAVKLLRRLNKDEGGPPLWADLGYLHQLAVASAIRAGYDFRLRVPVWRGAVLFPTLGLADVQSRREWDFAQAHGERGTVLVRGPAGSVQIPADYTTDGDGWLGVRVLRADDDCALWCDDIDPYREFDGPVPPRRLSVPDMNQWAEILRETWQLLTKHHPTIAAELGAGMTTLVPSAHTERFSPFSASHHDAFGAVVMSLPSDPTTFAETLVHEFQHSKFGVLLKLIDLLEPAADYDEPRQYAPWRDDPRPANGLLHGFFSFIGVTAFYRERIASATGLSARAAQFEFAYRREQAAQAVATLLSAAVTTAVGRRFLGTARDQLEAWAADELPPDVRAAAQRANADHRILWRLRHLRPPSAGVAELAHAWLRHRPRPGVRAAAPVLTPVVGAVPHARLALTRTWLTDPELFDVWRVEPTVAMAEVTGSTVADLELVAGATAEAADRYLDDVLANPESLTSWTGLALATCRPVLLGRPELVLAVHREIRSIAGVVTNPVRLAEWLG